MSSTPPDRARREAALARLLRDLADLIDPEAGQALRDLATPVSPMADALSPSPGPCPPALTPMQIDALDAMRRAGRPRKGLLLAKDCDRPYNSHFREALSALVGLGLAVRVEGGYEVRDRGT